MNEEDRKYLKNNIEKKIDNIEKSVSSSSKPSLESQSSKSLKDLYNAKSERDSRRKLLEEYKKQNENGEATIAQKMELLKETIETSIPKDFKDGMKAMGATMKKGANQALSGASHLTGRLMDLNPLTALLWQNRDIAKAVWDMGAGSLKMGWGLAKGTTNFVSNGVKGLYNGASALLNWGKNKLSPQKEEEIPDDVPTEKPSLINDNKALDEIDVEDFETSTAKKISEIHEYLFKKRPMLESENQKQEKSRHLILSKGLAGIGKTMKTVSGIMETIMAKQKMVLGGVVLGAVGILALVGWLKGGGLNSLLNKALGLNEGTEDVSFEDTSNLVDTQFSMTSKDRDNLVDTAIKNEAKTGDIVEEKKTIAAKDTKGNNIGIPTFLTSGYKMKANAGQPYRAPFNLKVLSWDQNKKNPDSIDMEVERLDTLTKRNAVIMNIENPRYVAGQTANKGDIIGTVPKLGEIFIKDISKEEFSAYKEMIDTYAARSQTEKEKEIKQAKTFMNASQSNKIRTAFDALKDAQAAKNNDPFEDGRVTKGDVQKQTKKQVDAKQRVAAELDDNVKQGMTIGVSHDNKLRTTFKKLTSPKPEWDRTKELEKSNVNQSNKTDKEIQQKNNQMKSPEIKHTDETINTQKKTSTENPNKLALNLHNPTPNQYPELFNTGQYYAATDIG